MLWRQVQSEQDIDLNDEVFRLKQLASGYSNLLTPNNLEQQLNKLQSHLDIDIQLLSKSELAFLPEQHEMLSLGQAVHLFDNEQNFSIFIMVNDSDIVRFGPFDIALEGPETNWLHTSLLFLSYLLLALLILLWSWPLWRDLKLLQQQTLQFSEEAQPSVNKIKKHSVIYPLSAAFQTMAHRIRELLLLQKQMTHAVSHDIRTPLARLKFSLEIIKGKIQTDDLQLTNDMLQDITEVENLIDEMLTYGRLEVSASPLNVEWVDIYQLCRNLSDKLNRASTKPIQLKCPDNLNFYCDGHLLERALQNLLTNAQTYACKKVELVIKLDNEKLSFVISDDGEGIDEQNKTKIFQPFTRLEKSRNKNSGGFGLGLAIVKKIVDWHSGAIELVNTHSQGATFKIEIPNPKAQ